MIEVIVLTLALVAGLIARSIGLPTMVGFLTAGFAIPPLQQYWPELNALELDGIVNIGITILLFTIGLKLDPRSLARPFIWGVASLHMTFSIVFVYALLIVLKSFGWMLVAELSIEQALIIGFALSFSSTVFAVKMLEEQGETASLHGKAAVGILIMQDIFAVIYLGFIGDSQPSWFALFLLLLIPCKPLLMAILKRCGHGELLVLAGLVLAYLAYSLFEWAGLKGGLGALFIGAILANTDKGNEMAKSLLLIKNLLLIGFFLSIGQYGFPSEDAWLMAFILSLILLIKPLTYFFLFTLFNLRTQTAFLGALTLNHYSEFGLIVLALAVKAGKIPEAWLLIAALAVAFSFIINSIINAFANTLYLHYSPLLCRFQSKTRIPEQENIDIGKAEILIMGMGRLGTGAYDYLHNQFGDTLLGFEEDSKKAQQHQSDGRQVLVGNASDWDLWQRLPHHQVGKIILTLSNHQETVMVANMLRASGYEGVIATIAKFDDHLKELQNMGVVAFNFYAEAGAGFAERMLKYLEPKDTPPKQQS